MSLGLRWRSLSADIPKSPIRLDRLRADHLGRDIESRKVGTVPALFYAQSYQAFRVTRSTEWFTQQLDRDA